MKLFRFNRHALAFAHDVGMAGLAFILALYLRMSGDISAFPPGAVFKALFLFMGTCAVVFSVMGLYRGVWAFTSMRDLLGILKAVTIAIASFVILGFVFTRLEAVPRTVPFIAWFILMAGLGGSRIMLRLWRERRLSVLWERSGSGRVNILLVGAGDEADIFMRAIDANPHAPFNVVGIVGENVKRVGRSIHGIEVMGTADDLPAIIEKLRARNRVPSRLVLTRSVSRFNGALVAQLLEQSAALGLQLSRLPALTELRSDVDATAMRDQPIAIEDLLGRPEIKLNRDDIRTLIKGRRVLITGAGGTIGGELVRQIAAQEPAALTLLEASEYNLYKIDMEVREAHPYLKLQSLLADVRDAVRIAQVFDDVRPELVFHAAAIKHVPIAEENIRETIFTNVIGTRVVADNVLRTGALAMVLISTDKAVKPSSVMGTTKRLAEMYCQALDLSSDATRFITVRFGNVLGSTGSVVPRFQEQLAKGGPITVTHPDITRYFMTAREAVELVLQASSLGTKPGDQRGKVLVLDMGQPVKIADLARQLIRLSGLRPDVDVPIVFTGLRPGEKLHEELFAEAEELIPSAADGVQLAKSYTLDRAFITKALDDLATLVRGQDDGGVALRALSALVPEYKGDNPAAEAVALPLTGTGDAGR